MTALIKTFAKSESGAVTVDWVVLTAAMVGLGMATLMLVSNGVEGGANNVSVAMGATNPTANPFATNGAAIAEND
jgi:Flp pilus assembly pilin Flp